MRTIESEIHELLMDLASDHDLTDQAKIVASATMYFEDAEAEFKKRTAGKVATQNPEKVREAQILDSILQAMERLSEWDNPVKVVNAGVDYDEDVLDASEVVRRTVSNVIGNRYSSFDILNEEDLNDFFGEPAGQKDYFIDDGEEEHDPNLYRTPGIGKHRSDSQARG